MQTNYAEQFARSFLRVLARDHSIQSLGGGLAFGGKDRGAKGVIGDLDNPLSVSFGKNALGDQNVQESRSDQPAR